MMKRIMGWLVLGAIFWTGTADAGVKTSNQFFYKPSLGARGAAEKNQFDAGLEAADAHLGKHKTLGDPGYATLAQALTTIGSGQVSLHISAGTVSVTANTTIPANVHLVVQKGGIFSVANGITLTINGSVEAAPYQIFSGSGAVLLGANAAAAHRVFPAWWYSGSGNWNTALAAAMAAVRNAGGGTIVLTQNISINAEYTHDYYYANFDGGGYLIDASTITSGNAIKITSTNTTLNAQYYQGERWVGNFELKGNSESGSVTGIHLQGMDASASASHVTLKNINLYFFGTGVKIFSHAYEIDGFKMELHHCGVGIDIPSGGTNYGARITFHGGTVYACATAIRNYHGDAGIYCRGSSIDSCAKLADISGGKVFLIDCHVEAMGWLAGGAVEAVKVNTEGGMFHFQGGWLLGAGQSGNFQYLVNVVGTSNLAVMKDVVVYDLRPSSGYLATGNGSFLFEPNIGLSTTDSYGLRWNSFTRGDMGDGGFETAAGGQLLDDWYVASAGTFTNRWTCSNLSITTSNEQARTGTYSLKANKVGAGSATFDCIFPIPRKGAMAAWQLYYRKPGNGTGTMYLSGYWVRLAGVDTNGIPIIGRYQEFGSTAVTFTSAAVGWTVNSTSTNIMRGDSRGPEWATHFVLRFNLNSVSSGQAYYFDDINVCLN